MGTTVEAGGELVNAHDERILTPRTVTISVGSEFDNTHVGTLISRAKYRAETWLWSSDDTNAIRIVLCGTEATRLGNVVNSRNDFLWRTTLLSADEDPDTAEIDAGTAAGRIRAMALIQGEEPFNRQSGDTVQVVATVQ